MRGTITTSLFFAPLALLLTAAACGSDSQPSDPDPGTMPGTEVAVDGGSYTNVTAEELQSMLDAKDFPLVNVHIPYEGEIQATDSFIPFNRIDEYVDELPSDPDSKIVVYCRSGGMSAAAAESLVALGYTNVWNLDGGMIAWEAVGYQLIQNGSATQ